MRAILSIVILGLSIACGKEQSLTGPSAVPEVPVVAVPNGKEVIHTFTIPMGATKMRVVVQAERDTCEKFVMILEQRTLIDETFGSCPSASGLSYDKTHAITGGEAIVRRIQLDDNPTRRFVWWATTE